MKEVGFKEGSKGDLACGRWEVIQSIKGKMEKEAKLRVGEKYERSSRTRETFENSAIPFHVYLTRNIFIA